MLVFNYRTTLMGRYRHAAQVELDVVMKLVVDVVISLAEIFYVVPTV